MRGKREWKNNPPNHFNRAQIFVQIVNEYKCQSVRNWKFVKSHPCPFLKKFFEHKIKIFSFFILHIREIKKNKIFKNKIIC